MCTVRRAVACCEKFFFSLGLLDYKRNYEFKGAYGGYVFAGIERLDDLRVCLYKYRLIDRFCSDDIEIEFDHFEKRIFIRIITQK